MNKLKRSKTSVSDLEHLDVDLRLHGQDTPPTARPERSRPRRGFSVGKVLTTATAKDRKTLRRSIDKESISRPSPCPRNPIVPPPNCTDLREVSPPPSIFAASSTSSSPGGSVCGTYRSRPNHRHAASDPTKSWVLPPTRPPPPIPGANDDEPCWPGYETPLSGIPESPFELERAIDTLSALDILEKLKTMEPARLQPPVAPIKVRALQQAKEMEELVAERAKRSGEEPPPYDFYELIGKGSYGRVYKGANRNTGGLVAIKIIDTDRADYEEMTSKNLTETLKEIDILQQLVYSKARPYVNIIVEARSVHNELWIVSEYASGGSVATLMKPCMVKEPFGLEEKFIIPIARELALGLKYTHEAGVLHRDLKCNNILIQEDGSVQLCDFGVSGTLEPAVNKRSTIVGTPNWMAPELQQEWVKDANPQSRMEPKQILYASEVDIWAYGCTIYEMASGFPPFHRVNPFDLPNSGIPVLEGDRHSQELRDFLAFVFQTNPQDRPTPDKILEHPYLEGSTKMYPTVMLVKLVEDYYKWEHEGGARASLFNPYGAQAPDPLAPEDEEEDDDWTFSTSDDFSNRLSRAFPDPFTAPGQPFMGINPPPDDEDRFAKLQASLKEDAIKKAGSRLNRIFDQNLTPYRYSAMDNGGNGRPPSDLILRDFNPGAPNRETVIDLDFAAPTVIDVPSIDLGEVPTLKANRVQKLIRDMQMEDEERDNFDEDDEYTKRATRDWTFPTNDQPNRRTQDWTFPKANENENRATRDWKFPTGNENQNRATRDWKFPTMSEESSNRKTHDFKFPPAAPKQNRATREWTFSAAMAEANNQNQRNSRRETKEWTFPSTTAVPVEDNRKTRDFVFPMRSPVEEVDEEGSSSDQGPNFSSSPTLGPGFRPTLRHAITEPPGGTFDDYPTIISSAPASPQRASMIDLDMAMVDDVRPSTSDSGSTATYTGGLEQMKENPFNLEDQVHLSQNNNRASYHTKSQSEPNHPIPGLLTPQQYDDKGHPTNQDPHHPSMHARGVSSVSQMQAQMKPPPHNAYHRANQRSQQLIWDGWSHSAAYAIGSDESPPLSISTDASIDSDIDEAWDNLERLTLSRTRYALRSRRTDSRDEDPRSSDTDDAYATDATYDDYPRTVRVSVGPNGRPLVDFPVPRGPGIEAMLGVDADPLLLQNALWKSSVELRDGLRASRDLLKAMKLEDVRPDVRTLEGFPEESAGLGLDMQGTVRPSRS